MTTFGDFQEQAQIESPIQYFIFYLSCFLLLVVMMNLLIGIISEKLGEVLEQREKNEYYELCQILYDIESLMFWKR